MRLGWALDKSEDVLANKGVKTRLSYWTIRRQVSQLKGSKTRISSWTNQRMFSQWEGSKTIGYLLDQSEDVLASDVFYESYIEIRGIIVNEGEYVLSAAYMIALFMITYGENII